MTFDRFDRIVWFVLGALALAIAGVILAGDHVGARITGVFPADGVVGARGPVGLAFGQPMQAASVAERFSVEPTVPGQLTWAAGQVWFRPAAPFQPGVTYTARLAAGALSRAGRATQQTLTWTFRVRAPWIAYLSSASGAREVWRVPAAGGAPEQLTRTNGRVYDYAPAPEGGRLIYSVVNDQNGADLWLLDLATGDSRALIVCGLDTCTVPAWSPAGDQLAYSREPAGLAPGAPNGPPRVWVADAASGQTAPLYADSQVLGYGPVWSPDGRRLAFFDGSQNGLRLFDTLTGQDLVVPTLMGTVGAWSPDSQQMLLTDMILETGRPYVAILRADFERQTVEPVLGEADGQSDYGGLAWSPDGAWVALAQRDPASGPARQIWLMRPDGSAGRAVTADPGYTFGSPRWDPWGTGLVFQRFELNVPYAQPELVAWSVATDALTVLARDATQPEWLP